MAFKQEKKAINIGRIIARSISGAITPAEQAVLDDWLREDHNKQTYEAIRNGQPITDALAEFADFGVQEGYRRFQASIQKARQKTFRLWGTTAAAVAILVIGFGAWLLLDNRLQTIDHSLAAEEILPGGNRAVLTLADGRTMNLDETQTGIVVGTEEITYQDGSRVMENEELRMKNERPSEENDIPNSQLSILNSITTPRGGTYQVTLADGSKVWLNSESTLKYPSRFSGDSREVILEGEAFFEIKKQSIKERARNVVTHDHAPFKVQTAGQVVEVLGTQFNVSAYANDPETKTTLVEGHVRVEAHGASLLRPGPNSARNENSLQLVPGEQAMLSDKGLAKREVDTEPYTAWKEGLFYFDNIPSRKVIEQVARWYDLEVVYEGDTPETVVFGMIDRAKPLSAVLNALAKSGLEFKVTTYEGTKQLLVSRK